MKLRILGAALLLVLRSCGGGGAFAFAQAATTYTSPLHVVSADGVDHAYISANNTFTSTVTIPWRWGYPKASSWATGTLKAGVAASPVLTSLTNAQSEPLAVELGIGTAAVVTMQYTYYCPADGSSPATAFTLAPAGSVSAQINSCPTTAAKAAPTLIPNPNVTTPPVTAPPVTTPPVTTPPVTTKACLTQPTATEAADGTITIVVPPYCMIFQPGGAYGYVNAAGYFIAISGTPSQALFQTGGSNGP